MNLKKRRKSLHVPDNTPDFPIIRPLGHCVEIYAIFPVIFGSALVTYSHAQRRRNGSDAFAFSKRRISNERGVLRNERFVFAKAITEKTCATQKVTYIPNDYRLASTPGVASFARPACNGAGTVRERGQ
jgi:hypothetical protein